jgi:HK97 gp10 family phage protein
MAFQVKARLDGLAGTLQALASKQKRVRQALQRKAMRRANAPVLKAAKGLLADNKRTGQLRKSLGSKVKAYKSGVVIGIIGPRRGFKITVTNAAGESVNVDPMYYAHLVEYGHGGPHPAPAHPFMRPAIDTTRQQVVAIIKQTVAEAVKGA